jgi:hypothetical protein
VIYADLDVSTDDVDSVLLGVAEAGGLTLLFEDFAWSLFSVVNSFF